MGGGGAGGRGGGGAGVSKSVFFFYFESKFRIICFWLGGIKVSDFFLQ